MYIETERTIIRNFIFDDLADLQQILGDEKTMKYCEPAYDIYKTEKFLHTFCIKNNGAIGVVHKKTAKLIGYVLFNQLQAGEYEIGRIFNRNFWHHGYAFESCKALIDYAFMNLKARKICAETIDVEKSIHLMQKLGMQMETILQNHTQDNFGDLVDLYCYSLVYEDWIQLHQ